MKGKWLVIFSCASVLSLGWSLAWAADVTITPLGTHTGEFMGVLPTGNRIQTTEISILRVVDGKIREVWVNVDLLTMLQQIGLVKLPG